MTTDRLKYIDCIKGGAILFVVFYHLIWLGIKDRDSTLIPVFNSCCMQLFFFLSGFVSYQKISNIKTIKEIKANIVKKIRILLIPSILLFSFCVWYYRQDLLKELLYEYKSGYWFTFVLFFIFSIHYIVVYFYKRLFTNSKVKEQYGLVILIALAFIAYCFNSSLYNISSYFRFISLSFILKYYIFFLLGCIHKQYEDLIQNFINRPWIRTVLFLISLSIFSSSIQENRALPIFPSIAQIILIMYMFKQSKSITNNNFLGEQLAFLGKHSLEIYFLHYYFLFGMPEVHKFITEQDNIYVFRGCGCKTILEISILLPISIILAYISILTRKILDICAPYLSYLLFGTYLK